MASEPWNPGVMGFRFNGMERSHGVRTACKDRVHPNEEVVGRVPFPRAGCRAESHSASPGPSLPSVGRGHSLAKGEVAVEPLRKLGDPGTPRPATPGAP